MLRACSRSAAGPSGRLRNTSFLPIARRTPLCQIPTPPQPRPLPIVLSRFNSSSRPPLPPPRPEEKPSSSSASGDQSYGREYTSWPMSKLPQIVELNGFAEKLNRAWSTPTKWYPIPIALGALVLLAVQFRKERRGSDDVTVDSQREGAVVRSSSLEGPWQVNHP